MCESVRGVYNLYCILSPEELVFSWEINVVFSACLPVEKAIVEGNHCDGGGRSDVDGDCQLTFPLVFFY